MGTLFLNSTSIASSKVVQVSQRRGQIFLLMRKNKSSVYCQGSGNAIRSSGFSSILTASTDLVDKGSLVLSPNGKNHVDSNTNNANNTIGVKNLVPFGGSQSTSTSSFENDDGIGILKFLRGKSFLITGGTGFLAKILIEKILRTTPDVGKIYLLIKAKDKEAAMARLKNEIINAELFTRLRQSYGKSYQGFMLSKLVPVIGNVSESDLGLDDSDSAKTMAKEVDVIVNSAANTTFDERYDVSLGINTKGPCHLMNFAKKCDKLKLFLQVSTAYVNGQRQGRVLEKAFRVGECIACESSIPGAPRGLVPELDIENEMRLGFDSVEEALDNNQKRKDLGLERAKKYGWQDTYVFTKAMGEMMLDSMREDVPVVIIRPSVIESTLKDPFPGWIEGNRMLDPIIVYYGKGQLTGFPVDRNGVLDVVPADMVVNATLAAMAKHGQDQKPSINVYQIASSVVNPLVFQDLMRLLYDYYKSSPYLDSNGRPIAVHSMELFPSMEDFSQHLWRDTMQRSELLALASSSDKSSQKLEILCRKWVEQATYLANIYEPYTFYGGRFDNSNTQRLMESMSEEEKTKFGFDVESIDWTDYITNVHIPGLRKHVMKGRGTPT